jgi:hypothetical protein
VSSFSFGATSDHPLEDLLAPHGASLLPQFRGGAGTLQNFFRVVAPVERMDEISTQLREHAAIAAAFLKPAPHPPMFDMVFPTIDPAASSTPDFTLRQGYLDAAPAGIECSLRMELPRRRRRWNPDHRHRRRVAARAREFVESSKWNRRR